MGLKVAQAQNEKKRMTQQYEREAKHVAELRDRLKDRDTYHDTLMGEGTARVSGTGTKMARGGYCNGTPFKILLENGRNSWPEPG